MPYSLTMDNNEMHLEASSWKLSEYKGFLKEFDDIKASRRGGKIRVNVKACNKAVKRLLNKQGFTYLISVWQERNLIVDVWEMKC